MYNPQTPIVGGIGSGVLATTGGGDVVLPLILAIAGIALGGLMIVRDRWLKRQAVPTA